uniref:Uncharacterized protein n=1 Tax=Oryza rufipogon TaxID=4529 RepID=A0A0E0NFK1_ORYRU
MPPHRGTSRMELGHIVTSATSPSQRSLFPRSRTQWPHVVMGDDLDVRTGKPSLDIFLAEMRRFEGHFIENVVEEI